MQARWQAASMAIMRKISLWKLCSTIDVSKKEELSNAVLISKEEQKQVK